MAKPKKVQTVKLVAPNGSSKEFDLQHAERLLDMGDALNGGWKIDPESNYYYDEEYGIRIKSDKGDSAKA